MGRRKMVALGAARRGVLSANNTRSIRCKIYWRMHEEGDSGEMGCMVKVAELGM